MVVFCCHAIITSMIVDGNAIADEIFSAIREQVAKLPQKPRLTVIVVGKDPVTERYLGLKKKRAEEIGITVTMQKFPEDVKDDDIINAIRNIKEGGIVVQLPLPSHLQRDGILNSIPVRKDVDVLGMESKTAYKNAELPYIPPTIGAIAEILARNNISPEKKKVVVVGRGMLVGEPAAIWFRQKDALVYVVASHTDDIGAYTNDADIIVCGVGKPGIITKDMIKEGVILLDAGTSEDNGEIKGDADPACAEKCSIFTPVPGGIGPITIACLLRNVVGLTPTFSKSSPKSI